MVFLQLLKSSLNDGLCLVHLFLIVVFTTATGGKLGAIAVGLALCAAAAAAAAAPCYRLSCFGAGAGLELRSSRLLSAHLPLGCLSNPAQ